MGEIKKKNEEETSNGFDYKKELFFLVERRIFPRKIADKIIEKLEEKNVRLTKNQFDVLTNKIKKAWESYSSGDKTLNYEKKETFSYDNNELKIIMDSIEKLERRLENLEVEITGKENTFSSGKIVTTDDIEVPYDKIKGDTLIDIDPLKEVPGDPESVIVLMKWLQFLVDKCSRSHLPEILDYYVDIGWISDEAKIKLVDYSNGITEENKKTDGKKISDLPSKDHIQSLIFIQKLKGRNIDKHFIDKIDSKLSRMTRKLDEHNLK